MNITKMITKVNRTIGRTGGKIDFIVIHYVGAKSTAKANGQYFANENRNASAHEFIDETDEIIQVVEEKDTAWHVGTSGEYKHPKARNHNTYGLEMCCDIIGGKLVVTDKVEQRTIQRVRELMKKFNLGAESVLRHYDVTGKNCPATHCGDNQARWDKFKKEIGQGQTVSTTEQKQPTQPTVTPSPDQTYRIRKTFADAKSQIGAYKVLENAKKQCKVGYNVYDNDGKMVYGNSAAIVQPDKAKKTIDILAKEVWQGKWGNEPQRSKNLKADGYDAAAVQKRVNELYGKK